MSLLLIFLIFAKIGLLTIGGGLAALPLLYEETVMGGWIPEQEFVDMLAISQSTPGPIGINMATFAGFRAAGIPGALTATAGMAAPSLLIISLIARGMSDFGDRPLVRNLLGALRPTAVGLVAAATWFVLAAALFDTRRFTELSALNPWALIIFAGLGLACLVRPHHPIITIIAGAVLGLLLL